MNPCPEAVGLQVYHVWTDHLHSVREGVGVAGLCPLKGCKYTVQVKHSWLDLERSPAPEDSLEL